jgi:hypothetical protein
MLPILLVAMLLIINGGFLFYMLFHPQCCEKHGVKMEWKTSLTTTVPIFSCSVDGLLFSHNLYKMELYCPQCEKEIPAEVAHAPA